jgi:hypothetical protein
MPGSLDNGIYFMKLKGKGRIPLESYRNYFLFNFCSGSHRVLSSPAA